MSDAEETFNEVSEILKHIMEDSTVPRNIRKVADISNTVLMEGEGETTVRVSEVIARLDEISNDPNIPVHARTLIWEILSKLEAVEY